MQKPRNYSHLYSSYIEGELAADEKPAFDKYLLENPQEKERIEQIKALRQSMQNLTSVQASADFDTILRARIQMEKKIGTNSLESLFRGWRFAALGAATAILLFIGYSMQHGNGQLPTLGEQQATTVELVRPAQQYPAANINYSLDHFDSPPANNQGGADSRILGIEYENKAQAGKYAATDSLHSSKNTAPKVHAAHAQFTY